MTIGGDALARPSAPLDVVADARRAEDEGFATGWSVHMSRAYDALTTLAVAGTQTARIELGVGVLPTYPRHPLALAQQAVTAQTFCGGRLTLGVGVSHRPVIEELHGPRYASPAAHMLAVVGPEADVEKQLRHFADLGVTDLWPVPFPVGSADVRRTRELLATL
jgi:alkanesulfonate monooxygenase SsuD/methylene tetrahydromethanopterin reductase-like flavin-dependent oxidoreductase (luciferase family)